MKIRFASALLALALPLCAQEPVAAETEALFYKAFYMEKGQRDFVGAMDLYTKFLEKAPEHKLAGEAAKQQFQLLDRTGKTKERDAFKAKYEKLLGNVAAAPTPAAGTGAGGAGSGAGGEGARRGGEGRGEGGPGGGRPDMAARVAELEKELAAAKAANDAEKVKQLEQQLERARTGGRGQGGPGGMGGRGAMGALRGTKKISEMSDEELGQLKEGLNGMTRMLDMMRENGQEEVADKVEAAGTSLKKALEANNKEDAQKALDTLRAAMPQRRGRGGEGGGAGGGQGGGRPPAGGGGGNNGGGGGN